MPEPTDLSGRTALVTGAARRLGRTCAQALAGLGADVVIHYNRSEAEARALADMLAEQGARVFTVQGDLAVPGTADAIFDRAVEQAGAIDILVNNASIYEPGRLADLTPEALQRNLDLHAFSPLVLARRLRDQGGTGVVINLLDARPVTRDPAHAGYIISKHVLAGLTETMAVEFAPRVRVNAVAPGAVLPPEGTDAAHLEKLAHANPLKRLGSADGIAAAVLYLVGADFVTGQTLYVDGGYHLGGTHDD